MPSQRDITEKQHDEAVRVLRAEYYTAVRSLVDEAMSEIKDGNIDGREGLNEWIWQSIDGSYWVIYTHANFQVLFVSDNHDAYVDEYGEPPIEGGDINWAALAFGAMRRDVQQLLDAHEDDIEALLSGDDDLDEARRRGPRARAAERQRTMFRLAPASDPTDFYAAGYDGNAFPTAAEANKALAEDFFATGAWQIVEVPYDAMALRMAGYTIETVAERHGPARISVGQRIAAGEPGTQDYDTGVVLSIRGRDATVGWDSGVTSDIPIEDLHPTAERHSGGRRMSAPTTRRRKRPAPAPRKKSRKAPRRRR